MRDFLDDIVRPLILPAITIILGIYFLVRVVRWYEDRYPCIRYEWVWRTEWTELRHVDCGKNCNYFIPVVHPAHFDLVCQVRGDREKGDVRAIPPPHPIERNR